MDWILDVSPIRLLGLGTWLALVVLCARSQANSKAPVQSRLVPRWLWAVAACLVVVRCSFALFVEAADADDWLYWGYANWIAGNPTAVPSLFTELANPSEPTIRILPMLWMALDSTWLVEMGLSGSIPLLVGHGLVAWMVCGLGRRLGLRPYGASLAGLIFFIHPAATEALLWQSAGREVVMMGGFLLVALCAHLDSRWWLAGVGFAAALLSREHALGFLALAPLCDWRAGGRLRPKVYAGYVIAVVVPMFLWRAWLFETNNAVQSSYLAELFDVGLGTTLLHGAVDMVGWFFVPITEVLPGAHLVVFSAVALSCIAAWRGGRDVNRKQVIRWLFYVGVFAAALVGPSLIDLAPPGSRGDETRVPGWNLRHLYGPVIGVSLMVGAALQSTRTRWACVVLLLLAASTVVLSTQYIAPSLRVAAAREAQSTAEKSSGVAVRFVQPQDAAAVFFLNRRILEPTTVGLPVLIGEPRCGCVALPIDYDVAGLARLRDVWQVINTPLVFEPASAGEPCRCAPWRMDATYLRFVREKTRLE